MKTPLYYLTAISFIVLSLLCLALILYGLKFTLRKTDFSTTKQKQIFWGTMLTFFFWLILLSVVSLLGFTNDFSTFPPRPLIFVVFPLLVFTGLLFTSTFTQLLRAVPAEWIVYLQVFRFFVEILLWLLFIQNLIPIQMTFEGRNFDILVGITAPIFAYFCFVKKTWSKSIAIVWNLAGLAILSNIVITAILSMPTPMRVFMNEPANTIVAIFPFFFLPSILVPLAYTLHLSSLRKLALR